MARAARLRFYWVALLLAASLARAGEAPIAVIVHPSRSETLEPADVARIFLRKQRFWTDDTPIIPLNREAGNGIREAFSRRIFHAASATLAAYWNEQYFLGTFPPATLTSSEAVKRYVAGEPGAIGYVEMSAVDKSVRVVLRLDPAAR